MKTIIGLMVFPTILAAGIFFWLNSFWAAAVIGFSVLWIDSRMLELIKSIYSVSVAVSASGKALSDNLEQTNKEIPRLDSYKGLWPL